MKSQIDKFKLHWGTVWDDNAIGNALGYQVHNNTLRKYVGKIAEITDKAGDVLIIISPDLYEKRIPNYTNWLFSMFEGTSMPEFYVNNLKLADYWIVPSTWVKKIFSQYLPEEKIFVVNHGVEHRDFTFKQRKFPNNRPFRYLWVGAPNPRKGWEEVIAIWTGLDFHNRPEMELYLLTTRVGGFEKKNNVILDGRKHNRKDLVNIYHQAHCFLFPTRAEGFGLPLLEAMATGLPCIATNYSGITDFFNDRVGYPVDYELKPMDGTFIAKARDFRSKFTTEAALPKMDEIVKAMIDIYANYHKALDKGKKAAMFARSNFTWEQAAQRLVDTIRSVR